MKNKLLISLILFFVVIFFSPKVSAQGYIDNELSVPPQEEVLEAKVSEVVDEKMIYPEFAESEQLYQKLKLTVTKGSLKDRKIVIESGNVPSSNIPQYEEGDEVLVTYTKDFENNETFYITDFIRRKTLLFLFVIFALLATVVGKIRGVSSLLGMIVSFAVIFLFILPNILNGENPILIAVVGSLMIIPITFYMSHGINNKTTIAIAGTLISLFVTGIMANIFIEQSHLTGFASEEAGFLQASKGGLVNIKGLLLAGIIVGVLGVLDDITVSQSAIVFQLKSANPKIKFDELFRRAMDVGQDHISSMVNTLILVYAGASLPLMLLFIDNPHPFSEVINYEIVAEEIVRTLVGSIGLIFAVPVTTFLASLSSVKKYDK